MKIFWAILIGFSCQAFAENTEFSALVRCVNYSGAEMTVVQVERRVVDIYTPQVRFEDRLVATTGTVDPGSSFPWFSGLISTDVKGGDYIYAGKDFAMTLKLDWSTMKETDNSGGFTVSGPAVLQTTNSQGQSESLELNCDLYDHM